MSHFQFQTVPNIISGLGSIQELQNVLASKTYRKLLLVTDAGMIKNQLHLPILQILDTLKIEHVIYADVQADPPEQVVLDAANYAKQQNVDVIVGFGGGSSLDVAK
ncbi:iron-containing alcohol dehydrogenase, partial [Acinetobacter baumannii]